MSETITDATARLSGSTARAMVVGELLARGEIALLHGDPRAGKTWLALSLGLAVAAGRPVWGVDRLAVPAPQPVLYVSNEDALSATLSRLEQLVAGLALEAPPANVHLLVGRGVSLDDPTWQETLIRELQTIGASLLILDPLRSVTAGVDQGPREWRPVGDYLKRVTRETGVAIVLLHHDVKPPAGLPDTRGRQHRVSGGGLVATCDAPLFVEALEDQRTLVTPHDFKFSGDPPAVLCTRHAGDGWIRLTGEERAGDVQGSDVILEGKILEYLEHQPGATGSAIARGVRKSKQAVLEALERLCDRDLVDSLKGLHSTSWVLRRAPGEARG